MLDDASIRVEEAQRANAIVKDSTLDKAFENVEITRAIVDQLKALGRRRPEKTTIRKRVEKALEEIDPKENIKEGEGNR